MPQRRDRGSVGLLRRPSSPASQEVEEPACKPDPVRGALAPPATISLDDAGTSPPGRSPARCGLPGSSDGPSSTLPARPCSGWGLPSRGGHPPRWCALTAPFHPYPCDRGRAGGLLSVALSVRSPPPGSRQHPALWSPDFPRAVDDRPRPPGRLLHGEDTRGRRLPVTVMRRRLVAPRARRHSRCSSRLVLGLSDGPARPAGSTSSAGARAPPGPGASARRCASSRRTATPCSAVTTSRRSRERRCSADGRTGSASRTVRSRARSPRHDDRGAVGPAALVGTEGPLLEVDARRTDRRRRAARPMGTRWSSRCPSTARSGSSRTSAAPGA